MTTGATALFSPVPTTPNGHFRLFYLAAVFRLLDYLRRVAQENGEVLETVFEPFPFLATHYLAEMQQYMPSEASWEETQRWWETEITVWEQGCSEHLPLHALREQAALQFDSLVALMLIGLVEEDPRFCPLFSDLQEEHSRRRPSWLLIVRILGQETEADRCLIPLLTTGLIEIADPGLPRSDWVPHIRPLLWTAIRGGCEPELLPDVQYYPCQNLHPLQDGMAAPDLIDRLGQLPAMVKGHLVRTVVIRGMQGSNGMEILGSVAYTLGLGILAFYPEPAEPRQARGGPWGATLQQHIGVLCTLIGAMPILQLELGPGETHTVPDLPGYSGPLGVLAGQEGGLRGKAMDQAVTIELRLPDQPIRLRHWQHWLGEHVHEDLTQIAATFQIPEGHIRHAAQAAIAYAHLHQRHIVEIRDVRDACRSLSRQGLDTLATRLDAQGGWSDLALGEDTMTKLRELERRCRYRERLLAHLSPAHGRAGRGVRALLSGPSGTGKTLAARTVAAVLDKDIYRVDLAAVVNKYIGETEKNLSQTLSRAEELDVILLLDEGDSLLGKRSEIKSSNDRSANMQTNYLLQRLETYQGIVLVTTNAEEHIDKAFQRRMDVVIPFRSPQPRERLQIWQLHLPANHVVPPAELEEVAVRCALSGGEIRNAALRATLLALDADAPVDASHLRQAVRSEYQKAGSVSPL